jgi:hypothetical protein
VQAPFPAASSVQLLCYCCSSAAAALVHMHAQLTSGLQNLQPQNTPTLQVNDI